MKSEEKYWVYILENPNGKFYIGYTSDLERRIGEHNSEIKDQRKFTHKNGPWRLVWFECHLSISSAMNREKSLKAMKSSKWIRERLLTGYKQIY